LPDLFAETRRILDSARERQVVLRLVGGLAVFFSSPSAQKVSLRRSYGDADFVGKGSETRKLKNLFSDLGYSPREAFNAIQGGKRLIFNDLSNDRRVDIFQDYFEMCHKFDLRGRLTLMEETIPMADLLATKLQVVQINDKDYRDILALLVDHELGEKDGGGMINTSHVAKLCSDDWGVYKTFTLTLGKVLGNLDRYGLDDADRTLAKSRAQRLLELIEAAPKSLKWRARASVGERIRWYETPEADAAVVDSRF
jgi:hypothetical protein